jgi:hypothetical protein
VTKGTTGEKLKRSTDVGSDRAAPAPQWKMGARRHEHRERLENGWNKNLSKRAGKRAQNKHWCRFVTRKSHSLKEAIDCNFAAGPTGAIVKKSNETDAIFSPKRSTQPPLQNYDKM